MRPQFRDPRVGAKLSLQRLLEWVTHNESPSAVSLRVNGRVVRVVVFLLDPFRVHAFDIDGMEPGARQGPYYWVGASRAGLMV